MKNITVSVDEEVYRRARIRAAEQGTSVSAVVKEALRDFTRGGTEAERRSRMLAELFERVDARLAGRAAAAEPGWRDRMYGERFASTALGRSTASPPR